MDNNEVIKTHRMPDGTEYRVSIAPDTDPQEPYDDGQWPILRTSTQGYSTYVEPFNDAAKGYEGKYAELMTRNITTEPAEVFERYLRIFHGVTQFHTYGPNQGTDYTYIAFDPKAWREAVGWADEAGGIEKMAEEKPLAEIRAWIEGDVWGWVTEKRWNPDEDQDDDEGWDGVESVWGYYGRSYATAEAESNLGTLVDDHKVVHRYTEHEKIAPHQSAINAILEFLETPGKGVALCEWERFPSAPHLNAWRPVNDSKHQRIVFEHFGIDYAKIEAERNLMFQRLREEANDQSTSQ